MANIVIVVVVVVVVIIIVLVLFGVIYGGLNSSRLKFIKNFLFMTTF